MKTDLEKLKINGFAFDNNGMMVVRTEDGKLYRITDYEEILFHDLDGVKTYHVKRELPKKDALKRLEKIDKEREKEIDEAMTKRLEELNTPGQIVVDYSNIKRDNAFGILVSKNVNIRYMRYCMSKRKGLRYYNASRYGDEQITYDEWELLKEFLGSKTEPK